MTDLAALLARADQALPDSQARLLDWLRIPSISAQPAHAADVVRAAGWARDRLTEIGFRAETRPTAGHPCVVAHHPGPGGNAPHLLYYGHVDVQPADPLELWTTPPFEPVVVDGPHGKRIRARGAVDDKGQSLMWMEALRHWHDLAGGPPVAVTVLLEGEEEITSPNLDPFLDRHKAELKADVAVISDTGLWDIDTPALTTRLRGILSVQLDLTAGRRDLHSGLFGGSARNPLNLMARILGELQDKDGRVQVPGFYDGVAELPPAIAAQWAALSFDEAAFLAEPGLSVPAGESGRPALERLWARPTCDVHGIWGGYSGPGTKTVIAREAHAKVSFRLVPGQDPQRLLDGLKAFIAARLPADCRMEVTLLGATPGLETPEDSRFVAAAKQVLTAEYGRAPALMGCGGSIPVVESLKRILGLDSLLMGFGLNDDQVHSPNEKFELRCFRQGIRSHVRLLAALAG
jgi:acetylornithine deacetylase/succinyl-diaminopimelate desuccinylase-like protein